MDKSTIKSSFLDIFYFFLENIYIGSKFWENIRIHLNNLNETQKWLSLKSGVGHTVINSGIARTSSPSADNAYAIACALHVSIEELIDGEAGAEYVREVVMNDPKAVQVPDRIRTIVDGLLILDEKELVGIRANVGALVEAKKGKGLLKTGTDDLRG